MEENGMKNSEMEQEMKVSAQAEPTMQEEAYKSGSVQYLDSREVAEIVEKKHYNLVRDIGRYIKELAKLNIEFSDFFIESSYSVNGQSRKYPCYLVTKKGCEFIAHKLTGEKGTLFTATYINRFHEMEDALAGRAAGEIEEMISRINRLEEALNRIGDMAHKCKCNPFMPGNDAYEEHLNELNRLTGKVAELSGISKTRTLHYLYRTLEERTGISLDVVASTYRLESGHEDISTLKAVAMNDKLYHEAKEMCREVIERKRLFG